MKTRIVLTALTIAVLVATGCFDIGNFAASKIGVSTRNFNEGFPAVFDERQLENPIQKNIRLIIIDPGHGGRDPGAMATHIVDEEIFRYLEKDINHKIAQILREKIIEIFPDTKVILTRDLDDLVSLESRTVQFNLSNLFSDEEALFISIHTNASINSNERGFEISIIDVIDKNNNANDFAKRVSLEFTNIFGNELPFRGIKQEQSYLFRNTFVPAIIVNIGFITNLEDSLLLYSEEDLKKSSNALFNGVKSYINSL